MQELLKKYHAKTIAIMDFKFCMDIIAFPLCINPTIYYKSKYIFIKMLDGSAKNLTNKVQYICSKAVDDSIQQLEGVHRTLTPRSTAVIRSHTIVTRARCDLAGTRISAKQQSHTEEYGVVHGGSNHIRKNTKEYGVLHEERIIRSS